MTSTNIIVAIISGQADDNLNGIASAVVERKKALGAVTLHTIKPGHKVRLTGLRPRYMEGALATVVERRRTRVLVNLDPEWVRTHPNSRYRGQVSVTPTMIVPA